MAPLSGVRILAIEQLMALPFGTQILSDFGADVVGVETVGYGGDEAVPWRMRTGRYKRRISVKLDSPEGQDLIRRLVHRYDVVVENFRPGVMDKYGLGYKALSEVNPQLIYCSVSGYGHRDVLPSPHTDLAAYGPIGEAMSGYTNAIIEAGGQRSAGALGDITSSMFACVGILLAIRDREQTGRGAYVDISMADALFALAELPFTVYTAGVDAPKKNGGAPKLGGGIYMGGHFPAADGQVTMIVINNRHWATLCALLGKPEWGDDPAYTATENRPAAGEKLRQILVEWASTRSKHDVARELRAAGLAAAPVMTPADICEDEHFAARRMIARVRQPDGSVVRVPADPIKLSTVEASRNGAAGEVVPIARPGEHTRSFFREELGLSDQQLDQLIAAGTLGD